MPVVFRHAGIWFFFFSNEGHPREPPHIHASRADAEARLWLTPEERYPPYRVSRREQTDLVRIVEERRDDIVRAWHKHFGDNASL